MSSGIFVRPSLDELYVVILIPSIGSYHNHWNKSFKMRFLHLIRPVMCVLPEVASPDRKVGLFCDHMEVLFSRYIWIVCSSFDPFLPPYNDIEGQALYIFTGSGLAYVNEMIMNSLCLPFSSFI
jgi:hypothetical protein